MQRSVIETIMGAVVLVVAAGFLTLAYGSIDIRPTGGFTLSGKFYSVDGLTVGSDVRIGGVKVGSVTAQEVDTQTFQAVVEMTIRDGIQIPADSEAAVASNGLLGGKYVKINAGTSDTLLTDGDEFENTKDVVVLEELLGKVIFLVTDEQVQ